MVSNDNDHNRTTQQKGTFFCFECEYSGHFSRDWLKICDYSGCSIVCPNCGVKIDQRTVQDPLPPAEAD